MLQDSDRLFAVYRLDDIVGFCKDVGKQRSVHRQIVDDENGFSIFIVCCYDASFGRNRCQISTL